MRVEVTKEDRKRLLDYISICLEKRIEQKGSGSFVSSHEILGVVAEEYDELKDAVRSNNKEEVQKELMDVIIGALWGLVSYDVEGCEW